jgi:hypothetical protein
MQKKKKDNFSRTSFPYLSFPYLLSNVTTYAVICSLWICRRELGDYGIILRIPSPSLAIKIIYPRRRQVQQVFYVDYTNVVKFPPRKFRVRSEKLFSNYSLRHL